jgi:hypothetical protein
MSINTSFIGISPITANRIDAYIRSVNPKAPALGEHYVRFGRKFGLRADLAAAQMILETGYLRFGEQICPEQHNPAGLKSRHGGFQSFTTWEQGVHAHYERLQCYVYPSDVSGQGGMYDDNYGHWRYFHLMEKYGSADRLIDVARLWTEGDAEEYARAVWKIKVAMTGEEIVPAPRPWLIMLLTAGALALLLWRLTR